MATYRRQLAPGAIRFFTLVTSSRAPLLTEPDVVDAIESARNAVARR